MRFRYLARDAASQPRRGSIEAEGEARALEMLRLEGLTPVWLESALPPAGVAGSALSNRRRARTEEKIALLTEISTLLGAGMSLADVLPDLAASRRAGPVRAATEDLVARVRQGGALSEGLADARLGYPGFVLALVRAGEASGELEAVLREAASQMEVQQKAAQDVKTSLVYPAILVLAGIGAILVIFLGVVPRFATLVASSRGNVPELSRWVIQAGVYLRAHIDTLAYAAAVLALVGAYLMSLQSVRGRVLELLLHLPVVGPWLKQVELGRWALVMGALLQNRVPLMQAIDLSGGTFRFRAFREAVPGLASSVRMGHSLAASLERLEWLDASRINMVRIGERAGQLAGMLTILGRTQVEAAGRSQRRLILLIEPAAILLIGGIIGIVMYAVMMAVVGLNSSVG